MQLTTRTTKMVKNTIYLLTANSLELIMSVIRIPIIIRFVDSTEIAYYALLAALCEFFSQFLDLGMSKSWLVSKKRNTDLKSLTLISFIASILFSFLILLSRDTYYNYLNVESQPIYIDFFFILILPITSLGMFPSYMLDYEEKFKIKSAVRIIGMILSFVALIVGVLNGFGLFALIFAALIRAVSINITYFVIYSKSMRLAGIDWKVYQSHKNFSLKQFAQRILVYLSSNLDYILLAKFVGQSALGFYYIAFAAIIKPLKAINPAVNSVVLSRLIRTDIESRENQFVKYLLVYLFGMLVIVNGGLLLNDIFGIDYFGEPKIVFLVANFGSYALIRTSRNFIGNLSVSYKDAQPGLMITIINLSLFVLTIFIMNPTKEIDIIRALIISELILVPFVINILVAKFIKTRITKYFLIYFMFLLATYLCRLLWL